MFELAADITVGQPQYASGLSPDGDLLSDVLVYNNVDGDATAFPTLSTDGTEVTFLVQTGNWNIAVVAAGGADSEDVATAVELLPADNEASDDVGYPIFRGASGNEILFLSDRDPAKVLSGDSNWDLYSLVLDLGDDGLCRGGPDKGCGVIVSAIDVVVDRLD